MKERKTVLIVRQSVYGFVIQRGRTADLCTCPEAAAALGVSLRWVHRYVRRRREGNLYQLGRPLLWRAEVAQLHHWLANRRKAPQRQRTVHPVVIRRRP